MKAIKRYKKGDFNSCSVETLADGSQILTLVKEGRKQKDRFRVRNLYQPDEEELDIDTGKPIAKRNLQ